MKIKVSAVVLTKNEKSNIKDCLSSLDFCKELVVIDDNSNDGTISIAKEHGARVISRPLDMNYSGQNNFAMKKAKYEWVLFVDADERISKKLRFEIIKNLENSDDVVAFRFRRIDFLWGKWLRYGESGCFRAIRLIRKGKGNWVRRVHQYYETGGRVMELENPIEHYSHENLTKFVSNINRWSTWHAIANKEEGKVSNLFRIICYPLGHFVRNYIFRLGFLDGSQGLVFALVMAGHSYLSWAKQWMLQKGFTKI